MSDCEGRLALTRQTVDRIKRALAGAEGALVAWVCENVGLRDRMATRKQPFCPATTRLCGGSALRAKRCQSQPQELEGRHQQLGLEHRDNRLLGCCCCRLGCSE
jgi:hypothetical protein